MTSTRLWKRWDRPGDDPARERLPPPPSGNERAHSHLGPEQRHRSDLLFQVSPH
jgi:hypothetical protein